MSTNVCEPQTFSFLPLGRCVCRGVGDEVGGSCIPASAPALLCTSPTLNAISTLQTATVLLLPRPVHAHKAISGQGGASSPWLPWSCWFGTSCRILGRGVVGLEETRAGHCHRSSGLQWIRHILLPRKQCAFLMPDQEEGKKWLKQHIS